MLVPLPARSAVRSITRPRLRLPAGLVAPTVAAVVSAVATWVGLGLTPADLHTPFIYYSDFLLIYPLVRQVALDGWSGLWVNPQMGFPGVQQWYDFPIADWFHLAILWALGRGLEPMAVFNVYLLLGYPLAAAAGAWGAGRLGASAPAAAAAGVLFSLLPYHQARGAFHLFLSAYFVVPVTCLLAVRAAAGGRVGWAGVLAAGVTGLAGAYYAFFGCVLLAAGAALAAAAHGWRAARPGLLAAAVVTAGGVAVHLPSVAYHARHGDNPRVLARAVEDVEGHALRLMLLAMPHDEHRSQTLAEVRWRYDAPRAFLRGEGSWHTLGFVPAGGLVACLLAALFPGRWAGRLVVPGRLALALALVAVTSGLNSGLADLGFTAIRGYDRATVYLGFFGAAAGALVVDRAGPRWRWPAAVLVMGFGVWDQTPRSWFTPARPEFHKLMAKRYTDDAGFFAAREADHPHAVAFSLPYCRWPEDRHEPVRAALHTRTWRLGYGAVRYREVDEWNARAAAEPAPVFLRRIVLAGFDELLFFRQIAEDTPNGHTGPQLADLRAALGPTAAEHADPDGLVLAWDLRGYRDKLRTELGAAEFDRLAKAEAERVSLLWLNGVTSYHMPGHEDQARWLHRKARAALVNPTDRVRRVTVRFTIGHLSPGVVYNDLRVTGPVWAGFYPGLQPGQTVEASFDLPPGRHPVALSARPGPVPGGYRPPPGGHLNPKLELELLTLSVTAD